MHDARGRPAQHHITYKLRLPDGRILRTRISRPADGTTYGARLWTHVLTDQLDVSEQDFWACVNDGVPPRRGAEAEEPPANALPAGLVHQLLKAGAAEADIAGMTLEQAVAAMSAHWSKYRD